MFLKWSEVRKHPHLLMSRYSVSPISPVNLPRESLLGVKRNNTDAKRNYFSSSRWNAAADILQTEVRLEQLSGYERQKRQYTKHNDEYWYEGGWKRLSREDGVEDWPRLLDPLHLLYTYVACNAYDHTYIRYVRTCMDDVTSTSTWSSKHAIMGHIWPFLDANGKCFSPHPD